MKRLKAPWKWVAALVVAGTVCSPALAQQQPAAAAGPVPAKQPYRNLAPGVVQTVDPDRQLDESFSRHPVGELLAVDANFDWAKDVSFRRDVWVLEFRFKPVRMLWVDVPQADGRMRRKLIWYTVYSVTNSGKVMHPVEDADNTYKVEYLDRSIRFVPEFLLVGSGSMQDPETSGLGKPYWDRVIPVAVARIRLREDPNRRFYNTAEICRGRIPVGTTVWGVATWEDVDPQIDRFSVYVRGLTNAYRWRDNPDEYQKGAPIVTFDKDGYPVVTGRTLFEKMLKLNFWRPGDEYFENEREIRYGVPGEPDYEWVYREPLTPKRPDSIKEGSPPEDSS